MKAIKARVVNGRLIVETPVSFPEGTEIQLQIADEAEELDADEQAALDASLARGWAQAQAGLGVSPERLIEELRALE